MTRSNTGLRVLTGGGGIPDRVATLIDFGGSLKMVNPFAKEKAAAGCRTKEAVMARYYDGVSRQPDPCLLKGCGIPYRRSSFYSIRLELFYQLGGIFFRQGD